jgi:hypothetical protein
MLKRGKEPAAVIPWSARALKAYRKADKAILAAAIDRTTNYLSKYAGGHVRTPAKVAETLSNLLEVPARQFGQGAK